MATSQEAGEAGGLVFALAGAGHGVPHGVLALVCLVEALVEAAPVVVYRPARRTLFSH